MKNIVYLIIVFSIILYNCANKGENSIRFIPKGFEGPVLIVFNQENGESEEYEDGKRIYRIPESGILKTKFKSNYGIQRHKFFYVDSLGNREEIPFVIVQEQDSLLKIKDKTKIYAFGEIAPGEGVGFEPKKGTFKLPHSREFYIGNLLDIEKSYHIKTKFSMEAIKEFRIYEEQ